MRLMVYLVAGVLISTFGCLQKQDCPYEEEYEQAIITYAGAPEVDGCGWLIMIGDKYYHPVNLEKDFQVENLEVWLRVVDDSTVFRCGRGGVEYPSVRIVDIQRKSRDIKILEEDQWDNLPTDMFKLDSALVDGDTLRLLVGYSGGCRYHEFELWKLPPNSLDPPPVEVFLSHNANGDMCEAYLTRWLAFCLKPIRERGKSSVTFLLRGSPEMSAYFAELVYKY